MVKSGMANSWQARRWKRVALVLGALALALSACMCGDEELAELNGGMGGKICHPVTGQPVGDAVVSTEFEADLGNIVRREETTDAAGDFEFSQLPDGDVTFEVNHEDFNDTFTVPLEANEPAVYLDPRCRELALPAGAGEIVGQICNRHVGNFVSDATVSILLPDGETLETLSDGEGNFALTDVPAGIHVVYVRAEGYSRTYQVEVQVGEQTLLEPIQEFCRPPDPNSTGKIVGRICTDDDQGLAGVRVFLTEDIDGVTFEAETDTNGDFLIAGVPAPRVVQVRAERGAFFASWSDVDVFPVVDAPEGTDLTEVGETCTPLETAGARYLVVDGFYDKIQNVLERMDIADVTLADGNPIEPGALWAADVFGDYQALAQYDAVFVNCGASELEFVGAADPVVAANLRQFVQSGGSLYVSDQAYDIVELVWPERIDFLFADADNSAAEFGADGLYNVDVTEPGLVDFIGQDELQIDFNFGYFALINEVAPGTTVYLRSSIPYYVNGGTTLLTDVPVTVGFTDGAPGVGGRVVFTSFHQENDASTGEAEVLDGPEDAVLRYLIFEL